uniref:Reverse transcriptase domain-containing protein n=1 Tax=Salarias fasciatus TaxID=181472 RepID=A0A672IAP0_SALFA
MTAVASMQCGKAPGPDGFSSEFFKKFSKELSPILLSVYEESSILGKLPETMRQAVISLIHKKGKSKLECNSYRPISLLNVDSKIFAKMLARRLESVVPLIVNEDQTGFIRNRYSFCNIRRLLNILHDPTPPDTPEVVLSLDAEKAFDRVEWDYLFYTLKKFGFGVKFVSWIRILYSCPVAAVRTNNNLSHFFNLERGTRQGCPLSPLLFSLVIEPLAAAVRNDALIKGVQRGDSVHKVSLYADDTLLYVSEPLQSLPRLLGLLEDFGKISGYKVNMQKSELIPINVLAQQNTLTSFPFKLSQDKFKYLGVWITKNYKHMYKANFIPLLDIIKQDLGQWSTLPLSLGGRINIIKMNVLPKFLYLFQCVPLFLTKTFFSFIDKLISSFIWNGKTARISKTILQRHREHGGFSLPNFQYYYWASNIRAMLYWRSHSCDFNWLKLEKMSCTFASLHSLLCSTLPLLQSLCKFSANPVVKHSFKIWAQFRRSFNLNDISVLAPIAHNHMFVPSIMDDCFTAWDANGLRTLKDMFVEGLFASFQQLKTAFRIHDSQFFRYLQLRSFMSTSFNYFPSCPPDSLLETILVMNTFSKVYNVINSHNVQPMAQTRRKWEEELETAISEDEWQSAINNIYSSSICLRHRVIQFKILHRLHWSKVRLAKIKRDIDPTCDRCETDPATLSHMFWSCSKLLSFWQCIFKFLSDALKVNIEPEPIIAIFGINLQSSNLNKKCKVVVAFATLIARRLILLNWKEKRAPPFKLWFIELLHHLTLEKIRYSIRGSASKFFCIWQPVLDQIKKVEPSLILKE